MKIQKIFISLCGEQALCCSLLRHMISPTFDAIKRVKILFFPHLRYNNSRNIAQFLCRRDDNFLFILQSIFSILLLFFVSFCAKKFPSLQHNVYVRAPIYSPHSAKSFVFTYPHANTYLQSHAFILYTHEANINNKTLLKIYRSATK